MLMDKTKQLFITRTARGFSHLGFNCKDLEKSIAFYRDILGCEVKFTLTYGDLAEDLRKKAEARSEKLPLNIRLMKFMKNKKWSVYMSWSEDTFIELFYIPSAKKRRIPNSGKDLNYTHYALVVSDLQEFRQQVIDRGGADFLDTDITMGLEHTWQMWMHDPDGNPFEVMQYTPQSYQITGR